MTKSLTAMHARRFDPAIRGRGADYHQHGLVNLEDLTEKKATAVVSGSDDYEVVLQNYSSATAMRSSCECPNFQDWGNCKHVWATLLTVEAVLQDLDDATDQNAEATSGSPLPPPPATPRPRVASPKTRPVQRPVALVTGDWRRRLAGILPLDEGQARANEVPVVEYYVEPYDSPFAADDCVLMIHARTRHRRKDRMLGVPRVTRLSADEIGRLPASDRALLAIYRRERRARWSRYDFDGDDGSALSVNDGWPLPLSSANVVLPLLASSGRAFVGPLEPHAPPRPLRIDIAEPFRFELVVEDGGSRGGKAQRVGGVLRRGEEVLPLDHVGRRDHEDIVLVGDRVLRIDLGGSGALARELQTRGPITAPAADVPGLLASLARLPGADQFLASVVARLPLATPIPVITALLPKAVALPVVATLQFDYDGELVPFGDGQSLVPDADGVTRRDVAAEASWHERAVAAGFTRDAAGGLQCPRERFAAVTTALVTAGFRVLAEGKLLRSFVAGKGRVNTARDWFEVAGEVEFTGHTAALPELLRRKQTPDGFVELGDGSFGLLPDAWLRRIETLRLLGGEIAGEHVRLPSSQALLLDAMLDARSDDFAIDRKFAAVRQRLASFHGVEPRQEPTAFRGELRPYQRGGLGWLAFLRDFGLGGCLADDMGLGKTVQVLAHLVATVGERRGRPNLIVAPRSVLPNWLAEAARFAPALRVLDFSQPDRWQAHGASLAEYDLVLSTYGLLRADAVQFAEREQRFHHAILDEAQVAKNGDSQISKAVRLLAADHRLALTGTPVENHLGELWTLFEFLNPGMLGRVTAFRALFGRDVAQQTLVEHRELLQRALRPVLLRRTKAQVLTDLPPKVEQTLWCELEPAQRRRYDELRAHYRALLLSKGGELGDKQRFVVLEALLRLRQAACHEGLLDPTKRAVPSAKLEALLQRLVELAEEGHKALVFSQFTGFLDLVEPALKQRGIVFERLDGSTRDRAARVERFQTDPQCPVFLISLKAGGFGLNLTAADYVFVLDPWWNPATEMQAIDRAHRIGQKKVVHAFRLVCRGTVEERVLELQAEKKQLCEAILGNERSLLQDLTRSDLELLLG